MSAPAASERATPPVTNSAAPIVIGAGPAGLACAVQLVDRGVPVRVFEAAPHVGGLGRSFPLWGQTVDLGPHRFFSSDRIVTNLWQRFAGEDCVRVDRLTRILYGGKLFRYPLEPLDAFQKLGPIDVAHAVASYGRRRLRPNPDPRTFEEWVTNRFGGHLFRIFFKTYSEKLWGIPCSRIDSAWAAQRIKGLSLTEAAKAALFGGGGKKHKTLVDQFAYPRQGAGVVYERMTEHVRARGGTVQLGAPVRRVLQGEGGAVEGIELADGTRHLSKQVVSSMPLTLLVKGLANVPAEVTRACERLRFRNTLLVYLEVDREALFPDNWIYVHAPEVRHGRITNFRNWSPGLTAGRNTTILCLEFWCFDEDELWTRGDAELGALAERELRQVALLPADARVLGSHVERLHRSYPVYETGFAEPLGRVQSFVESVPGLRAIGRYGAFKYNNQDHSLLMGLLAATELLTGRSQNLWDVNTDSAYQESAEVQTLFNDAGPGPWPSAPH